MRLRKKIEEGLDNARRNRETLSNRIDAVSDRVWEIEALTSENKYDAHFISCFGEIGYSAFLPNHIKLKRLLELPEMLGLEWVNSETTPGHWEKKDVPEHQEES